MVLMILSILRMYWTLNLFGCLCLCHEELEAVGVAAVEVVPP